MKKVFSYLLPQSKRMAVGLSVKTVGTLVELLIPYILTYILESVVKKENIWDILAWGSLMAVCAFLACIGNIVANRMAAKTTSRFSESLRRDLFERTLSLSASQTDRFTIPSLESRITTDTYNVHNFVGMMQRMGVRAPLLLIGGIAITLIMDASLALVMIATLPFIFFVILLIRKSGIPLYTKVQSSSDKMVRVVREDTVGIRVIKALSKNEYENGRFDGVNKALSSDETHAGTVMGAVNPIMNLFMNGGITAVVAIAAYRVSGGVSETETVIAFIQYFTLVSMAMMALSRMFVMYTKCAASARRIAEVLNAPEELTVTENGEEFDTGKPHIEFSDVSFSYNKTKNDLDGISFKLCRGESLGIIGATGSGKSTLIKLLLRFYEADEGEIRIFGKNITSIDRRTLTDMFGVALQNDFLYADTVAENISFGRDISEADIEKAAKTACAHDFISAFPEGYAHELTQKGTNISGGQKQRILIARAVAASPEILILDDSSSALDYKTDATLRANLKESMKDSTVITVAQRVSSVKDCDKIIVLEGGRIIGIGAHEELLLSCTEYKEISDSQMGGAVIE